MATATANRPQVTKIGKGTGSSTSQAKPAGIFEIIKVTVTEFLRDNCLVFASAIAYNALFSIFPLILAGLTILSFVLQDPATRDSLTKTITDGLNSVQTGGSSTLGSAVRVGDFLDRIQKSGPILGIVTLLTTLYSGVGVFGSIMFGINQAWNLTSKRNIIVQTLLQILLFFTLGGLFLGASIVNGIFSWLQGQAKDLGFSIGGFNPFDNIVTQLLFSLISWLVPVLILTILFTILYKIAPDTKNKPWRPAIISAAVVAVLFQLLQQIIPLYLSLTNASDSYSKTYGAFGTVVLFLFLVYIGAAIVLLGAELNSTIVRGGAPKPVTIPEGESRVVGDVEVTPKGDEAIVAEAPGSGTATDSAKTNDQDRGLAARSTGSTPPPTPRPVVALGPVRPAGLPDRIVAYVVLAGIFLGGILGALRGPGSKGAKKANKNKKKKK